MTEQFDPEEISFAGDVNFVRTFLLTKPDGAAWKDFFAGSAGTTIVEFLAAMKSFTAYHTITGRAEAFLAHAKKLTSARAAAEFLGHNSARGTRAHYRLTIDPNFTGTIDKFDILGTVRGLDVVAMETKAVNSGVEAEVEVVFGDLKTESLNVSSGAQRLFRFTSPNVSDDFRVLLNSVEVTISQTVSDLSNDKSVTLTNAFGALDLFDLNDGTNIFDTGDTFQLQFVEFDTDPTIVEADIVLTVGTVSALDDFTAWVASTVYALNAIVVPTVSNGFYYRATVAGTSGGTEPTFPTADGSTVVDFGVTWTAFKILFVKDVRLEAETIAQLQVNAPLTHETQKLVRGRDDYLKLYKNLDVRILDTNGQDKDAAIVFLTAVKSDLGNFSTSEKTGFVASLSAFRPFGVQPPIIVDPVRINLAIRVDITLLAGVTAPGDTTAKVTAVVDKFGKVLEQSLDLGQMEALINQLRNDSKEFFVQTTRLTVTTDWAALTVFASSSVINPVVPAFYFKTIDNVRTTWKAATGYDEGDLIVPTTTNGFAYEADSITGDGLSGSSEPTFPLSIGGTVVDNEVTWKNIGPIIKPWRAGVATVVDEMVSPVSASAHYFKAIDNIETTWQASTVYVLGNLIVPTNGAANPNEFLFEATSVSGAGLSGTLEPTSWPTTLGATQVDNDIVWTNRGTVVRRWQPLQTYTAGDIIVPATPTSPVRRAFRVTSGGLSGSSEPIWDTDIGDPTTDGTVAWVTIAEGDTGATEPTFPTAITDFVGDGARTWSTLLIGRTGVTEPAFPSTVGQLVVDDAAIWRNEGLLTAILAIEWDEYWVFTTTVIVA